MSLWHTLTPTAIAQELQTDLSHGLSSDEARKRLASYGANALPEKKNETLFHIFISQFQSPLIFVLAGACLILFLLGELNDAFIIAFILIFNAVLGTIQEGRAQNTLAALKKFITTEATVLRDRQEVIIPDTEVVPGDILILKEGEKIAADARIIESYGLRVDEAALTGESGPVDKSPTLLKKKETTVSDKKNMIFKGSSVLSGTAFAVIVATGTETEIGKMSTVIALIDTDIPLKKDIRKLSQAIIKIVGIICGAIFLLGIAMGNSIQTMFATTVTLSVSIIPEGLPIVLTLVLANGVWRMAKRNALVKKMQAVEALGQAHVIAVDKTGTITRNELIVRKIYTNNTLYDVSGVGYAPSGSIMLNEQIVDTRTHYNGLLLLNKIATLTSNAHVALKEDNHEWRVTGDPTEAAMVVLSEKLSLSKEDLEKTSPRISEIPFDYKTRYHATLHKDRNGYFIAVAGAPEAVLSLAASVMSDGKIVKLDATRRKNIEEKMFAISQEGYRIISLAYKKTIGADQKTFTPDSITELVFAGFYAMEDSIRPETREAVSKAKAAGLHIVMMTGDHRLTAQAIAKEVGIYTDGDHVLIGEELETMSPEELDRHLPSTSVFARVTPAHKMILIQGYKRLGSVIAMTGDGVNDAAALVSADLGIAMGKIGTEVAKEASDIVLLDDNFASIVAAIEEGRRIFHAMRRVIFYLFSTSVGEVLVISGSLLGGLPLPLLPAQIIWLNLVTDTFLDVALGMERRGGSHLMLQNSSNGRKLIDKTQLIRMIFVAMPMALGTLYLFLQYYQTDMAKALTISLTTLAAFQWFNAWNVRSEITSIFRINPFSNKYLVGALTIVISLQIIALYNPVLQKILHTIPLTFSEWMLCIGVASSILVVEEVRKFFARQKASRAATAQPIALASKSVTVA